MANYEEKFNSKLDWSMPFQRTGKFPLDRTKMFSSKTDADKYAAGDTTNPDSRGLCGTSYIGQIITVFENDTVTAYQIQADRTLKEIGSGKVDVDGKSITLVDGVLGIKGFKDATQGMQPRINASGEIEWVLPDTTTVEGLDTTVKGLQSDVTNLTERVGKVETDKVDKVDGKGLSTEDFTTEEKEKLAGLISGAQINVLEGIKVNGEALVPTDKVVDISVPTKISELENDSNFIDTTVENLANYYLKTETYSQEQVNSLIGQISTLDVLVVDELPTEGISKTTIYLVPKEGTDTNDVYDEYIYVESTSSWEMIGNTIIDLSNYLQKDGDASELSTTFVKASERELPTTSDKLGGIIGKIVRYLTDLKTVAFTGSYNDLKDKPTYHFACEEAVLPAGDVEVIVTIPEGGKYVSTTIRDIDGIEVFADVVVSNNTVNVSISEGLDSNLTITVAYYI